MAAADYWSQAQLDPAYLAAHGGNKQAIIQAILGYGSSTALSPELAAQYGITPDQTSAADQNPYSVRSQLAKTLSGDRYQITNNAQAHGALYSGAHAAAQAGETQAAGQRNYNASRDLAQQIAGIGQNDTNSLTGAYTNIANQALNTPTPVAPTPLPAAAPDGSFGAGYVAGQPGVPVVSAGGATNTYNAAAPQNQLSVPKVKLPALPKLKTGLQGHL